MVGAVERLTPAEIERERALLGLIANAVDGLQIVDFGVRFETVAECVACDQASSPLVGRVGIANPAAYLAVERQPAK